MLESLARPWSTRTLVFAGLGVVVANALYCLIYTALAGQAESVAQALAWSVANLLPWVLAFEAGKRMRRPGLAVLAGGLVSLALGLTLLGAEPVSFVTVAGDPGELSGSGVRDRGRTWQNGSLVSGARPAPSNPGASPVNRAVSGPTPLCRSALTRQHRPHRAGEIASGAKQLWP